MKKVMTGLLLVVVLLTTGKVNLFANQSDAQQIIVEVNQEIQALIVEAQMDARDVLKNDELTELEQEALIDAIITNLIAETEEISNDAVAKAALEGYNVICEYKLVKVGGEEVLIDPLRVVGW